MSLTLNYSNTFLLKIPGGSTFSVVISKGNPEPFAKSPRPLLEAFV